MKTKKSIISKFLEVFRINRGVLLIYKYFLKILLSDFIFTKYTSPTKLFNLLLILLQHFLIRGQKVVGYTIKITVDPTSYCNLRCPLCPTGNNDTLRSKGFMSFELFKKIIDEVGRYVFVVDFWNWGEPLLNKDIFRMIRYANEKRIKTRVSTNMTVMNEEIAQRLIESGLDVLFASIDGVNRETYSKYRVGADFEKVMANLRTVVEVKKKLSAKNPQIIWQFIIMRHNEHEVETVLKIARELGVKVKLAPTRPLMGYEISMSEIDVVKNFANWFPSHKYSRFVNGKNLLKPKNCPFLWTQGVINWNGSVSPCCSVYPENSDFGNILSEGSFMAVWNGKNFRYARAIVKNKTPDPRIICSECVKKGYFISP